MNRLPGIVSQVASEGGISLVDVLVGEDLLTAMLVETPETAPYLVAGWPVHVLFKETEVSLGKNIAGLLSLRNRLKARVTALRTGSLLAEVTLVYRDHSVVSIITRRAVERLQLAVGDEVEALVKANELILGEA